MRMLLSEQHSLGINLCEIKLQLEYREILTKEIKIYQNIFFFLEYIISPWMILSNFNSFM